MHFSTLLRLALVSKSLAQPVAPGEPGFDPPAFVDQQNTMMNNIGRLEADAQHCLGCLQPCFGQMSLISMTVKDCQVLCAKYCKVDYNGISVN